MGKFQDGVVSVVTMDKTEMIRVATQIRRAGIPCETHFSGNIKKQMKKSADLEAVVLIMDDGIHIKDMLSGNQRPVSRGLIDELRYVLTEGYYDD